MNSAVQGSAAQGSAGQGSAAHSSAGQGGGRRGDTRARIQQIALELFAEQGYERTSLREIAERLGVTKAALYYHFKSKEDIVGSFTEDYLSQLDDLVTWAKEQPRTPAAAEAILDSYIGIVMESREVFRFLERNQAMLDSSESGKHHRLEQFRPRMSALVERIAGPDAPARSRVRATAAFFAVSVSCMFFMPEPSGPGADDSAAFEPVPDPGELRKIVVELANDIIAPSLSRRSVPIFALTLRFPAPSGRHRQFVGAGGIRAPRRGTAEQRNSGTYPIYGDIAGLRPEPTAP